MLGVDVSIVFILFVEPCVLMSDAQIYAGVIRADENARTNVNASDKKRPLGKVIMMQATYEKWGPRTSSADIA